MIRQGAVATEELGVVAEFNGENVGSMPAISALRRSSCRAGGLPVSVPAGEQLLGQSA